MNSEYLTASEGRILWIEGNCGDGGRTEAEIRDRATLENLLCGRSYQVRRATGCQQAWDVLKSEPCDVILVETRLPDGTGYELCHWLKSRVQFQQIPVILMESPGDRLNRSTVFNVGGADYLMQPLHPQETIKRVEYQITLLRQQRQLTEQNLGLSWERNKSQIAQLALEQQQAFLRMVIDANPNLIFIKDWNGRFTLANRTIADLYGTTVEGLLGKTEADFNPNRHQTDRLLEGDREIMAAGKARLVAAEPLRLATGEVRWFQTNKIPLISEDGKIRHLLGVSTDITERQEAERALWSHAERERLLRGIVQQIHECLDLDDTLKCTVTQVREFLGADRVLIYRPEAGDDYRAVMESVESPWQPALGTSVNYGWLSEAFRELEAADDIQIRAIADTHAPEVPEAVRERLEGLQVAACLILPLIRHYPQRTENDGGWEHSLWGLLVIHQCGGPREWRPEEIEALRSLATPIAIAIQQGELYARLQVANRELEHLATLDGLTGLANRRQFDTYLHREWQRMLRDEAPLSAIMGDVDFFKAYNDTYGHQMGDECLKAIAKVLDRCAKRPADLACRYGGEEFAIVLPDTPPEGALQVAEEIRTEIQKLHVKHETSAISNCVTLSLGIACRVPTPDLAPEHLIELADAALYEAKRLGRNRIVCDRG
ncbi:diguanylate cyclase [Lyngbya sp. CCY1209]|uniref:diguanylate cyclase n=1 Tax=Lyngbya sp. CCY1209 TaxID=2886103 RepID=UPI002D206CA8|nr:diguanylate cyclase [Lyngbya sp. CCY1209]MEB3881914.1 diguanylate cyclase [Lyngbya sp. CCY1209]